MKPEERIVMADDDPPRPKLEMGIDPASIPNDIRVILRARREGNGQLVRWKRLPGPGMFRGVCAGLAYRFGWRLWKVRLVFILASPFGLPVAYYLLAMAFVPIRKRLPRDFDTKTGKKPARDP